MLITREYNRGRAFDYARHWAYFRNPLFLDYEGLGGDCTSFVSQAIYAGTCQMNETKDTGWYFFSDGDRSPSWTGVRFLYEFLTGNQGVGPFGEEVFSDGLEIGDVIQLANAEGVFYHSLLVVGAVGNTYLVAAHSIDTFGRTLSSYSYAYARYIHILGARTDASWAPSCFDDLIAGISIGNTPKIVSPRLDTE